MALQVYQLSYDFGFAGMSEAETSTVTIGLRIFSKVFKATIAISGATCSLRVNLVQVTEYRFDGSVQAVEIEAIEAYPLSGIQRVVVTTQPANKVENVRIAPHPCGEASESTQGLDSIRIFVLALYIAINPVGIRPVGLHRYPGEFFFENQPFGNQRTLSIKLMCSMRCLAE